MHVNAYSSSINEEYVGDIFAVKETPGSGLGAYALRFLPRLTVILIEDPILSGDDMVNAIRLHQDGTHLSQHDDECYLRDVVGLDDATRQRLWQLHDQYVNTYADFTDPSCGKKRLFGIIKSNMYFSTDENRNGLYPIAARLNHSCSPNVGYGYDGWKMRMYTTRDIQAGEELYSCYSDVVYHGTREFRQAYLEAKFNFECQCHVVCNNSSLEMIKVSDDRRSRLKFLSMILGNCSERIREKPNHRDLELILECITLLTVEGIDHNIATMYEFAYETAHKLKAVDIIQEQKLGYCCLTLLEASKGIRNPTTEAFHKRLSLTPYSL